MTSFPQPNMRYIQYFIKIVPSHTFIKTIKLNDTNVPFYYGSHV